MIGLTKVNENWAPLQAKVFSRWVSNQLKNVEEVEVQDVCKDLSNGVALVELAKVLTHEEIPRLWTRTPRRKVDMVENCNLSLEMFKKDGVNFVGISGKDISDNNEKLILGLIWTLILHYSVNKSISTTYNTNKNVITNNKENQNQKDKEIKEAVNSKKELMKWAISRTENYPNVHNFKPYDLSLCALLDSYFPQKVNYYSLNPEDSEHNNLIATKVMEEVGIPVYVYADELSKTHNEVDDKTLLTQLSSAKEILDKSQTKKIINNNYDDKQGEIDELTEELEEQTEDFKEEYDRLNLELRQALDEVEIHKIARKNAEDQLQKEKELTTEAQYGIANTLRHLYKCQQENEIQKKVIKKLDEEINLLSDQNSKQEEEIERLNNELSKANEQIDQLKDTMNDQALNNSYQSEIERLSYALDDAETYSEIQQNEQENNQIALDFFSQAFIDLQHQTDQLCQQKVESDEEIERLRCALDMAQIEIDSEREARQDAEFELENMKNQKNCSDVHNENAVNDLKVQSLLSAIDEVEKSEEKAKDEAEKLRSQLDSTLKRNKAVIEAYSDAVESALDEARQEREDREDAENMVDQLTYLLKNKL